MLESHGDVQVVAEAADGAEAVELAERHSPDVAVLDIGMQKMNGLKAAARISVCSPRTAILMLTVYNDNYYAARAVKAGARGYLLKESLDGDELVRAIRTLQGGGYYFSPEVAEAALAVTRSAGGSV
jgi:two-component system, NarL family, response regulator NreC